MKNRLDTTGYDSQRTVFRYAQKACGKVFFGDKLLFWIKIENFYPKQQLISNRFFSMSSSTNKILKLCVISKISICCLLFCCVCSPSVFAQKLIKIGYGVGHFQQKPDRTYSILNAQSLILSYEKGIKTKFWTFGVNLECTNAKTYFQDNLVGSVHNYDLFYTSLGLDWKYYFGQRTNDFYIGTGLLFTAYTSDFLSGVSAQLGWQKQVSRYLSVNTFVNMSAQMPIDDPGPLVRYNFNCQLAYNFPFSKNKENAENIRRIKAKTAFKPSNLLKIGIGTHMLFVDGPKGGSVNATLERALSPHWSMAFNAELMGNSDLERTDKLNEFRLLIQPDFRYYPQTVFQGFYIGSGLGIVGGYGRSFDLSATDPRYKPFSELIFDIKLGVQTALTKKYVGNIFISPALLGSTEVTPLFRAGIQVGVKK